MLSVVTANSQPSVALDQQGSRRDFGTREPGPERSSATRLAGLVKGTNLLTPRGYRPIELLRTGDLVGVLVGRGPMFVPIEWIGRRWVRAKDPPGQPAVGHVRVRRDAIGQNMPHRDVLLAPDHAIYFQGSFYLPVQLVNHTSILFADGMPDVEYWGVRLERHTILLADNLPVESLPAASTAAFTPVSGPALSVVPAGGAEPSDGAVEATFDLPARVRMSTRWYRRRLLRQPATELATAANAPLSFPPDRSEDGLLDVDVQATAVLGTLAMLAARRGVKLEKAVETGLQLRMEPARFREMLGALLTHAIHTVAAGRVLLGAMRHADRIQIAIIDTDGRETAEQQEAVLREAAGWAALAGGTLDIEVRPGEGTTLLLSLLPP